MRETPFFCPKAALGENDSSGRALGKRFPPALGRERHPEVPQVRKPKPSCAAILTPKFPVGQVTFPVIFLNICSSRIPVFASLPALPFPAHPTGAAGDRQGHNPVPNSIPGCAVDSQRDFGLFSAVFSQVPWGQGCGST